MNAAVNGRFLSRQITGVERYGHEILHHSGNQWRVVRSNRWARGFAGHAWEQLILPGQIRTDEILWSPANTGPLAVTNQVLTVHDLTPLENPGWFAPHFALWYRLMIPRLAHRVRHITVPSVYVRDKLIRFFQLRDDQVTVVPGGVDTDRFKPRVPSLCGSPKRYLLFVGSVQSRKNLDTLLQAWQAICYHFPDVWLLAAGGTNKIFHRYIFSLNIERFRWLGYVAEADLPGLYANAEVFVLPSLDEGFGLPILEAMACGTPVIAARAGAMPEVATDAALYFNPSKPEELTDTLELCLQDAALRGTMKEKGLAVAHKFSWDNSARKLWEVLQQCQ